MTRTLLKKQLQESLSRLTVDYRTGKRRDPTRLVLLGVLLFFAFCSLGGSFVTVFGMLCKPLTDAGYGWLYFALAILLTLFLGIVGSVFNTYSTVYKAKDNDFLLSMPVKPSAVLTARLMGVFLWTLVYEAIVFVPALGIYWITVRRPSAVTVVCDVLLLPILGFAALALSCLLGWVVAKISVHVHGGKSGVQVALSLAAIALYYVLYNRAFEGLKAIINNVAVIGEKFRAGGVLYVLGRAGEGDVLAFLATAAVIGVVTAAVWTLLSRSFLKLTATANGGEAKRKTKTKAEKTRGADGALLMKERKRLTASANYMLNCALGTVLLPAAGVALLVKGQVLLDFVAKEPQMAPYVPAVIVAALCLLSCMNDTTAPSVSLEGETIWLVQTMPVHAWQVLRAKLRLHLILTEIPLAFCGVCAAVVLKLTVPQALFAILVPAIFAAFMGCLGLAINLKSPNLHWTNEVVPVKQSVGVLIAMLGGWGLVIALVGVYALLSLLLPSLAALALIGVLLTAATVLLRRWLKTRGAAIFDYLN